MLIATTFSHEDFILNYGLIKNDTDSYATYVLEWVEKGEKPHVTIELGNEPFADLVLIQKKMAYETLLDLKQASETNASPGDTYIRSRLEYQIALPEDKESLYFPKWDIYVMSKDTVIPLQLKEQTLTWTVTGTKKSKFWRNFLILLEKQWHHWKTQPVALLVLIGSGLLLIIILSSIRRRYHKRIKGVFLETFQNRYRHLKIEELYYQKNKGPYFEVLLACLMRTEEEMKKTKNISHLLKSELVQSYQKLNEFKKGFSEDGKSSSYDTGLLWVRKNLLS